MMKISALRTSPFSEDPMRFSKRLRVGVSTDVEYVFLQSLLCKLRIEMPKVPLSVQRVDPSAMPSLLASGEISFGIGLDSRNHRLANMQLLRTSKSVVLRADTGPGPLSLKEICYRPHASVNYSINVDVQIDEMMRELGHNRKISVEIPHFENLPSVLARTDYLAIVPDYVGEQLVKRGGLRSELMPMQEGNFGLFISWRAGADDSPSTRWLRSRCSMILGYR
ncbi:LysR substrate-binding domain-containing protein [Pseudomonas sp. S2_H01]